MPHSAFSLHLPHERTTPFVFSSPHSGRIYSQTFRAQARLDERTLRSSEDAFVDMLFSAAPDFGAPLIAANYPRAWIDLNRAADELDPGLIEGIPRQPHNPRISSGLGVIPRVVSGGRQIYDGKISRTEAEARLTGCWQPYHAALRKLIDESHALFGEAVLVDCHSMPHEALEVHWQPNVRHPDIVLGDRFGASASRVVVDQIEAAFTAAGLVVARNTPFAGAYIAQSYGRPSRHQHVIQIEIDRALYMNEITIEPLADFDAFRSLMTGVIADITAAERDSLGLAAE